MGLMNQFKDTVSSLYSTVRGLATTGNVDRNIEHCSPEELNLDPRIVNVMELRKHMPSIIKGNGFTAGGYINTCRALRDLAKETGDSDTTRYFASEANRVYNIEPSFAGKRFGFSNIEGGSFTHPEKLGFDPKIVGLMEIFSGMPMPSEFDGGFTASGYLSCCKTLLEKTKDLGCSDKAVNYLRDEVEEISRIEPSFAGKRFSCKKKPDVGRALSLLEHRVNTGALLEE